MKRVPLVAAGLTVSVCLATATAASATPSQALPSKAAVHATSTASAASATPRQASISRIQNLLTAFYTDQQLSVILDRMSGSIYDGKSRDATFDALSAVDVLNAAQIAKLLKMESGLRKDLGAASGVPHAKARTVFLRNFQPFYSAASAKILSMKRSGATRADCHKQVDVMLAAYLTKANITRALTEYKNSLTSNEWRSVRTHGSEMLRWSLYGL